jgi:hypothetical protein
MVADAMHPGVVTCPLETPLRDVAWMMGVHRIHAVVVFGEPGEDGPELWGVRRLRPRARPGRCRRLGRNGAALCQVI